VTNDHLFEWIIRTTSTEFPELQKSEHGTEIIARELGEFLKLTEGDNQANPVRARVMMQLAELEIRRNNPQESDRLLDLADTAWSEAGIKEDGFAFRMARARLAGLLQSLDKKDASLTNRILPKARKNMAAISGGDANEIRRNNAVMQIINGSMMQVTEPAKALEHFLLALKDLEGVHNALPEHVAVRSELARYALRSASIADSLDMIEDAAKLRSKAATQLRWILQKNPELKVAKVKLAEIDILAAEADMRIGNDAEASAKLTAAEKLLSGLPADDTSPDGVSMQAATAMGLRSVFLRDRGKTTDAAKSLDQAIELTKKIVAANPEAEEPLYRLAVFHWQRSGISGDAGDTKGEINQGKQAAELMQHLLKDGARQRDTALRRTLAYLYGNLGHTALSTGQKEEAIGFFKNATAMWQSLIDKIGKAEEYTEGLKWSQSRYHEAGGK
jgi:tetratricopeptide (TPR) repeat protein